MSVPDSLRAKSSGEFELELRANRAAQQPSDDREVSIAVCNIVARSDLKSQISDL